MKTFNVSKFLLHVFFSILIIQLKVNLSTSNPVFPDSCVKLDGQKTCYSTDPNPYRNFGSKTSYPAVNEDFTKIRDLRGCTPKVFYMLSRHATRYPGEKDIDYINKHLPDLKETLLRQHEKGKTKLCQDDINKLKKWSPVMIVEDDKRLSATGAAEAKNLGKRLRKKYPEILGMKYSPLRFIIEYTSKERTRHTAGNFSHGMFTELDYENIEWKTNDPLLQYHNKCKDIMKICGAELRELKEVDEFTNGSLMQKVRESVSDRIGFSITNEEMMHMHAACSFGYALNISDAWCSVFSRDELKVIEYSDDIESYYRRSYGNTLNYQQACPVIKYLVDLFKSFERTRMHKVVLHFTHNGAISRLFSALGIFRDDKKLTSKDFCTQNDRKWRTSSVVPFNTNIVFILYECFGDLKIMTLHNEKPVRIDGCKNDMLCSLDEFYDKYQHIANNCDLKKICDTCKIK